MTHTDYIVAIDLGTSHLVGMVGRRNASGKIFMLAWEIEDSASCIRRGCVYNVEETAQRIHRLVLKLQNKLSNKLPGFRIEQVYVGVGGQSLRSMDHSEVRTLSVDEVVTEGDIHALDEQCQSYRPDMLDVLGISSPVYFLDDKYAQNPVGIPCKRIEARFKLIVGRPSIRKFIVNSIERAKISLAGIIVSPLALADVVLSQDEKDLGCVLINFGAGVTSVVVYKGGNLIHLSVIPFGGKLITRDLMDLHLVETEAERLKITYGSALLDKNKEGSIPLGITDGVGMREIEQSEVDMIVEARAKEIVENVYARIEAMNEMDSLGAGIILTGGASALKNLQELIQDRFKQSVRYATVRKKWLENSDEILGNPDYMTAISLLAKGKGNCASDIVPKVVDVNKKEDEDEQEEAEMGKTKKAKKTMIPNESKIPNLLNKLKDLFNEE